MGRGSSYEVTKSDEEWHAALSDEQFRVLRRAGTEPAGTGALADTEEPGLYRCSGCGAALFRSEDKFHSGTGWPSFTQPVADDAVEVRRDFKMVLPRREARCARCGGHLGHVFSDGPRPTGQRWCMNSAALDLDPAQPPVVGGAQPR